MVLISNCRAENPALVPTPWTPTACCLFVNQNDVLVSRKLQLFENALDALPLSGTEVQNHLDGVLGIAGLLVDLSLTLEVALKVGILRKLALDQGFILAAA